MALCGRARLRYPYDEAAPGTLPHFLTLASKTTIKQRATGSQGVNRSFVASTLSLFRPPTA
jgi:hypothetical protein